MNETLFVIPQDWFQTWIFGGWCLFGFIFLLMQSRQQPFAVALRDFAPLFLIVAGAFYFILPRFSLAMVNPADPTGELIAGGLAIRGYGLFLMIAILLALLLVTIRCREAEISVDHTLSLCFVMIVSGLGGARAFYVLQKWDEFQGRSWLSIFDMTSGGLVVYGSLIGGLLGAIVYLRLSRLPFKKTFDVLAPAMVLGLAIGRIGCLMNGCCYGGQCGTTFPLGLSFPAASPPYMQQLDNGSLLGIEASPATGDKQFPWSVDKIADTSPLKELGLQAGDQFAVFTDPLRLQAQKVNRMDFPLNLVVDVKRLGPLTLSTCVLPERSFRIHPTQIYASVNAFLLCGLLYFLYPLRRFDGQVFAVLMILYPITRFLLEIIRTDEGGQFGTNLSISQWVSLATVVLGFASYVWCSNSKISSPSRAE